MMLDIHDICTRDGLEAEPDTAWIEHMKGFDLCYSVRLHGTDDEMTSRVRLLRENANPEGNWGWFWGLGENSGVVVVTQFANDAVRIALEFGT